MTTEECETGVIGWQTYKTYIQSAGGPAAVAGIVFISMLAEGCRAFGFWWLGMWISDSQQVGETASIGQSAGALFMTPFPCTRCPWLKYSEPDLQPVG